MKILWKIDLFITENHYFWQKLKFSSEITAKCNKKSRAVNIAQWNIDFQYQYQYIEDIDAGIDIEFRFLRILILILILRLEKILVLILILILIVFQGQYWYWSWYWKWNFRKYWYWTKIWYCPMSGRQMKKKLNQKTRFVFSKNKKRRLLLPMNWK